MISLGHDTTYGAPSLKKYADIVIGQMDKKTRDAHALSAHDFISRLKNNEDWLIPLLCQYDRNVTTVNDAFYMSYIKDMISEGCLYMALYPVLKYAMADNRMTENHKNITDSVPLSIQKKQAGIRQNSDGVFQFDGKLELHRLYINDDETPEVPETIYIDNPTGTIEIGLTPICKTAFSLMTNSVLLRVPYRNKLPPYAAFFFSTKSYNIGVTL